MRLFVTGVGGHLGRTLAARAPGKVAGSVRRTPAPPRVAGFPLDVRDGAVLAGALAAFRPDAVVHTAYVQGGEEMAAVNVGGAAVVARAARLAGARLVHLSSDAIFSGGLLDEEAPADPLTPYGATKADAEAAVRKADPGAVLVRTSLLYGGEPPPRQELMALEPGTAFYSDEVRCPIHVDDLADAVLELCALPEVRGPLNVAGSDAVSRHEFARLVVRMRGGDPDGVASARRPPGRPGDVRLDCSRARALLRTPLRGVREVLEPRRV